ncbi:MAG: DEAD/DEAH box helicase [Candidatus Magasanikbacteria bacterium]|jgi:ATP-dependent RNA helicase RhlE|nr:DEAD/DEAH box helicase [Candidatus Magasanikbacteria bacterium]MBT4315332.1 DEAD/DEAH box helicase [Candidatus Magasanikbacteria bacterium]MBT4547204.1 DEAD/DEAH box helicase [Candidatus Magasanikbacteria bacterium]MBT6818868.1 DEAD/DEAH box helicase [Candidatus Magasanikbacteria bacterium]
MQKEDTGRFSDLGIASNFLTILSKKGFETPTPIQRQVIAPALEGKDIVGIAQTGTGKTLAFGIPMIQRLAKDKGQGLILVPTRELALQVEESLKNVGTPLRMTTAVVIGGVSQHPQVRALQRNPHIVIATPGRLMDLIDQRAYSLKNVNIITLDEGDRMLDMGFLPEIKKILSAIRPDRQTMLFSATMPKTISSLATRFMKLPLRIEIAPQGTSAENTDQEVFVVRKNDKMRLLDAILEQYKDDKVLVFSRTKHGAKRIARDIGNMNHTATEIHGNRSQAQRVKALDGFTKGRFRVMVATDIAARGIDVKDINLVINFDLPDGLEDYVHRIGRTGRAGKSGKAISFVTPSEKADVRKIERLIRKSLPILTLPKLPPERERPVIKRGFQAGGRSPRQGQGGAYNPRHGQKNSRGKRSGGSGSRNKPYSRKRSESSDGQRSNSSSGQSRPTNSPRRRYSR